MAGEVVALRRDVALRAWIAQLRLGGGRRLPQRPGRGWLGRWALSAETSPFARGFLTFASVEAGIFLNDLSIFHLMPLRELRLTGCEAFVEELADCAYLGRLLVLDLSYNYLGN